MVLCRLVSRVKHRGHLKSTRTVNTTFQWMIISMVDLAFCIVIQWSRDWDYQEDSSSSCLPTLLIRNLGKL